MSGSFKAEIEDTVDVGGGITIKKPKQVIALCRSCAEEAGYKVKHAKED